MTTAGPVSNYQIADVPNLKCVMRSSPRLMIFVTAKSNEDVYSPKKAA